eukprot:gene4267-6591_t
MAQSVNLVSSDSLHCLLEPCREFCSTYNIELTVWNPDNRECERPHCAHCTSSRSGSDNPTSGEPNSSPTTLPTPTTGTNYTTGDEFEDSSGRARLKIHLVIVIVCVLSVIIVFALCVTICCFVYYQRNKTEDKSKDEEKLETGETSKKETESLQETPTKMEAPPRYWVQEDICTDNRNYCFNSDSKLSLVSRSLLFQPSDHSINSEDTTNDSRIEKNMIFASTPQQVGRNYCGISYQNPPGATASDCYCSNQEDDSVFVMNLRRPSFDIKDEMDRWDKFHTNPLNTPQQVSGNVKKEGESKDEHVTIPHHTYDHTIKPTAFAFGQSAGSIIPGICDDGNKYKEKGKIGITGSIIPLLNGNTSQAHFNINPRQSTKESNRPDYKNAMYHKGPQQSKYNTLVDKSPQLTEHEQSII